MDSLAAKLRSLRRMTIVAAIIGAAGLLVGMFLFTSRQFYASYLFAFVFWVSIPLGALALLMIHHLAGGKWSALIRRFLEAAASITPLTLVLFLPLLFDLGAIYPWARPEEVEFSRMLEHKAAYLNPTFFIIRTVIYLGVFAWLAYDFRRFSLMEENQTIEPRVFRNRAAGGLVLYMLLVSFAAFDWTMSLSPHWFSTMYGFIYAVDQALTAHAFLLIALVGLHLHEPLARYVDAQSLNDLGNFLLALVILWGYVHFMQFLIIWNGNLGEKVPWYLHRTKGAWQWLIVVVTAAQFAMPLILLLMREYKRSAKNLGAIAAVILTFRAVNEYWFIMPSIYEGEFHVHIMDAFAFLALGGVVCTAFFILLGKAPIIARNDPVLTPEPSEGYEV